MKPESQQALLWNSFALHPGGRKPLCRRANPASSIAIFGTPSRGPKNGCSWNGLKPKSILRNNGSERCPQRLASNSLWHWPSIAGSSNATIKNSSKNWVSDISKADGGKGFTITPHSVLQFMVFWSRNCDVFPLCQCWTAPTCHTPSFALMAAVWLAISGKMHTPSPP